MRIKSHVLLARRDGNWSARQSVRVGFEARLWCVVWQGQRSVERRLPLERHARRVAAGRSTLGVASEALIEALRTCTVVHGDETGWRIGTLSAWLWVFTNQKITVYTIETSRGHEVVMNILGKEFKGVLVSDCFLAYDHHDLENWLKQKCLSHLLKDLKELTETKVRGAVRFAPDVKELLQSALALKAQKEQLSNKQYARQTKALEVRSDELTSAKRKLTDPHNARFAKRLRKHRKHILRFLYVDELDATKVKQAVQLRPAVITRKTNGCNRTSEAAHTHAILGSVLATFGCYLYASRRYTSHLSIIFSHPLSIIRATGGA